MDNLSSSSSDESSLSDASSASDDSTTKAILLYLGYNIYTSRASKSGNACVDRTKSWEFVLSWSDEMFFRQFRFSKNNFSDLAFKLKNNWEGPYDDGWKNYRLSITRGNASTDGSSISVELKLCITLRLLAGASYLDMVWYGISADNVFKIFFKLLNLINKVENSNISWPTTEEAFKAIAKQWSDINIEKRGFDLMPGTIAAGDGSYLLLLYIVIIIFILFFFIRFSD